MPCRAVWWVAAFGVDRCIDFLREKADCVPPEGMLSEAEEAAVSRSLELVRFLLRNFDPVR